MQILRILGKFLISVGMGVLMFVGWTLWGTGFYTRGVQSDLRQEFHDAIPAIPQKGDKVGQPPKGYDPGAGRPVFLLKIPAIKLDRVVVEGVGIEDLKKGPGHYPACRRGFPKPLCTEFDEVWPGEEGRVVVSGHRTTYEAPFWDLDKLRRGDEIITKTKWGTFTYTIFKKETVPPDSAAIVVPGNNSEIVLTTCNPKFSASERLVVFGKMEELAR
jgi:sortase A